MRASDLKKGGYLQQVRATVSQRKEIEASLIQTRQGFSIVLQGLLKQTAC